MKQVERHGQTVHYRFLRRTEIEDIQFYNQKLHLYTLLGLAKCNNSYLDIYRCFFPSFFKKTTEPSQSKIERQHVSYFFHCYLDIIITKYYVSFQENLNTTGKKDNIYQAFSHYSGAVSELQQKRYEGFQKWLEREFNQRVEQFVLDKKKVSNDLFERIKSAREDIRNKLKAINKYLDENFNTMNAIEYLVQFKAKNQSEKKANIIMVLMSYFQSVANIDLIFSNRRTVLKNFINANRSQWRIQINEIVDKTGYKIGEQGEQGEQKVEKCQRWNDIIMPQPTKDRNPILMRLKDFIPLLHQSKANSLGFNHHQKEAIRELIKFITDYRKNTNQFYPNLQLKDLFWDQKQLKIIVSYTTLLEAAYCLDKNIKTFEMGVAFDNTPDLISEKSYKEEQEQNQILLRVKYYFPDFQKDVQQMREEQKKIFLRQSVSKDISKISLQERLKIKYLTQEVDLENIHVWRLLSILYFITQNESLSKCSFQNYRQMHKGKDQKFSKQSLKRAKKWFFENIQKKSQFQTLLKPIITAVQQQNSLKKTNNDNNSPTSDIFDFKLCSLQSTLGMTSQQDSLLDDMKDAKKISDICLRQLISGQISQMLSQKRLFTGLANVKKYVILIFVYLYEEIQLLDFELSHHYKRRMRFAAQYKKMYNGIVLEEERLRRIANCNKIIRKFDDYEKRNDKNKEYLANNNNLKIAKESQTKIKELKKQSEKLKVMFDDRIAFEDKINSISSLEQSLKHVVEGKDFKILKTNLKQKNFLDEAQIQINSMNISKNKQFFIKYLLTKAPDSLRRKLIRELIATFQIPIKPSQQIVSDQYDAEPQFDWSDDKIDNFWQSASQQQFLDSLYTKINFPEHSQAMLKILKKCFIASDYNSCSQRIVKAVDSYLKKQLAVQKQKVKSHFIQIFQTEVLIPVDDIKQFFLGRDTEGRSKILFYKFLTHKLAGLIVLCLTPDSINFNRENIYNTFFKGFDCEREKKDKNGSKILQVKIQNIKTQILEHKNNPAWAQNLQSLPHELSDQILSSRQN